ncbi:MAG: SAM-dependent methyltransferase [Bacteroidales bacterium]|nr:SAM-dependent methyltransferase [Bacteroidales bacterium]
MDTRQFIETHLHDDVSELALKYSNAKVDMALALRQIAARQLLRKKVPSWSDNPELLFPVLLPVEQCSSQATAQYKATLLHGNAFADLTGGLGVDCYYLSQNFQQVDYVEQNPELCELARHNFRELSALGTQIHNESAESYLSHCNTVDCLFIDPARRDVHGRKTVGIADCTPNVIELQDLMLQKATKVLVKLSPMLDISKALEALKHVKEVHVVAVANECKELLFLMEQDFEGTPTFTCVNLESQQPLVTFTLAEEQTTVPVFAKTILNYLYEPNAAVMKGGCYKLLTQRYHVQKLHKNSHLYTSEQMIPDFPGRVFKVDGWAPYNKKLRQTLLAGVEKASIATRNFPLSVADLRKTLKIADGDEIYLFATIMDGDQKVIISTHKAR